MPTAQAIAALRAKTERIAAELGITDPEEFETQWKALTSQEQMELIKSLPPLPRTRAKREPQVPVFPVTVRQAEPPLSAAPASPPV